MDRKKNKGKLSAYNGIVHLLWRGVLVVLMASACESLEEKTKGGSPSTSTTDTSTTDTSTTDTSTSVPVTKPAPVVKVPTIIPKVYAGDNRTCIVIEGAVSCWGGGSAGGLVPAPISGWQSDVSDLGVGDDHSCAVFADGRVECMGQNMYGQIGKGVPAGSANFVGSPIPMVGLLTKSKGISSSRQYSCVVTDKSDVECWGENWHGNLGDQTASPFSATPIRVSNLGGPVSKVVTGARLSCALLVNGTVECWGNNTYGQLGIGHANPIDGAQKVQLNHPFKAIDVTVGWSHACALLDTGQVLCWGEADYGRLGIEPGHPALVGMWGGPSFVMSPVFVDLTQVQAISAGDYSTCALTVKGEVFCWGLFRSINSKISQSDVPVQVQNLPEPVKQISVGGEHICAVLQSGKVVCWGNNSDGQLGDGTQKDSSTPVFVKGL